MTSFVMRVWLSDRPGALGAVTSRIGAVGGDLTGIDILERGEGRVIDELTIDLPGEEFIPLMLAKVGELDGVDVEDVRNVVAGLPHPHVDALEVAADLLGERAAGALLEALVIAVGSAFSAEWVAVIDPDKSSVLASSPGAPNGAWLEAFLTGTRSTTAAPSLASEVAWAGLEVSGLVLLIGRTGRPFRARERRQLATIARIADHRWREIVTADGAPSPSGTIPVVISAVLPLIFGAKPQFANLQWANSLAFPDSWRSHGSKYALELGEGILREKLTT